MVKMQSLPPTTEYVLDPETKEDLIQIIQKKLLSTCANIYLLCSKSKAIKIGSFILGSKRSKHRTSSRVLVACYCNDPQRDTQLVQVNYYLKCTVVLTDITQTAWVAAV